MATVTQPTEASVREQHLKTKRLAWEAWSAIPSTSDVAAHKAAELVKLIAAEKVLDARNEKDLKVARKAEKMAAKPDAGDSTKPPSKNSVVHAFVVAAEAAFPRHQAYTVVKVFPSTVRMHEAKEYLRHSLGDGGEDWMTPQGGRPGSNDARSTHVTHDGDVYRLVCNEVSSSTRSTISSTASSASTSTTTNTTTTTSTTTTHNSSTTTPLGQRRAAGSQEQQAQVGFTSGRRQGYDRRQGGDVEGKAQGLGASG
jgi:hypothetical protein